MAYGSLALDEISTSGNLTIAGNVITAGDHTANTYRLAPLALGSPITGEFEYDGRVPYFTPAGTQRGVVPGMQYYRLNTTLAGANATTNQSVLGVGVTLSSNTVYQFDAVYGFSKTAGTTSHSFRLLFGGTAITDNIAYVMQRSGSTVSLSDVAAVNTITAMIQTTAGSTIATSVTSATAYFVIVLRGTVSVNTGGTFIPQYNMSSAPGGAYTTAIGSYFSIYPVGAAGTNISVGTWA
jgi:hypothetical protein